MNVFMDNEVQTKLTIEEINKIIACPNCKGALALVEFQDARCDLCNEHYSWLSGTWDLIQSSYRLSSDLWPVWEQLQANGLVSYAKDPEHNLGIGERPDCLEFSQFCEFDGLVLDVGCGPQALPAYHKFRSDRTRFVGIDPLIRGSSANFVQFRALGEYLPFRNNVFDHVVFATSLDHFIDPTPALVEARRVSRSNGQIDIWIGEKRLEPPKTVATFDWYMELQKPNVAEDVFHLRRLQSTEVKAIIDTLGLHIVEERIRIVDGFKSNFFCRIKTE